MVVDTGNVILWLIRQRMFNTEVVKLYRIQETDNSEHECCSD